MNSTPKEYLRNMGEEKHISQEELISGIDEGILRQSSDPLIVSKNRKFYTLCSGGGEFREDAQHLCFVGRVLRMWDFECSLEGMEGELFSLDSRYAWRNKDVGKMFRAVSLAKGEFNLLREKFGIFVDAEFILVKQRGQIGVLALSDRVCHQKSLGEKRKYEELYIGLVRYYREVLESYHSDTGRVRPFLWDLGKREQYIYGTTHFDSTPQFRLVDIDPHWLGTMLYDDVYAATVQNAIDQLTFSMPVPGSVSVFRELGLLRMEWERVEYREKRRIECSAK